MNRLRAAAVLVGICVAVAAVAANKEEARAYAEKATTAYALAHYDVAAENFEKAFEAKPDPALLFNAAQAHRMAGNKERALALYQSYLRLPGKLEKRAEVEKRIAELRESAGQDKGAAPPATPAPAPPPAPAPAQAKTACPTGSAQIDFEAPALDGVDVAHGTGRSFAAPTRDGARVWCGRASVRVRADFNLEGARTSAGHLPFQLGEVFMKLPTSIDLTNRTLTAHVYIDGPAGVTVGAAIAAWNRDHIVDGKPTQNQPTGRWLTLQSTFGATNRLYAGGTSKADEVDGLVVQLWALGTKEQRTWSGTVYVDDVGWR
jgi:hypothetical protein